jgi:hypothetical protein
VGVILVVKLLGRILKTIAADCAQYACVDTSDNYYKGNIQYTQVHPGKFYVLLQRCTHFLHRMDHIPDRSPN